MFTWAMGLKGLNFPSVTLKSKGDNTCTKVHAIAAPFG